MTLYSQQLIGELLRRARHSVGLSIREVSAESGVSAAQILRIESGEYDTKVSTLAKVAAVLGVPPGILLEQGTIPNPGFFAQRIGENGGVASLIAQLKTPKEGGRTRSQALLLYCARLSAVVVQILRSSNPTKLARSVRSPVALSQDFLEKFAEKVDEFGQIDRIACEHELSTNPLEFLARESLVTPAIAGEIIALKDSSLSLQANAGELIDPEHSLGFK